MAEQFSACLQRCAEGAECIQGCPPLCSEWPSNPPWDLLRNRSVWEAVCRSCKSRG